MTYYKFRAASKILQITTSTFSFVKNITLHKNFPMSNNSLKINNKKQIMHKHNNLCILQVILNVTAKRLNHQWCNNLLIN